MLKRGLYLGGLLLMLVISTVAATASGDPAFTKIQIRKHRCLVAGPAHLSDDAPVVFILHGLGSNAGDFLYLIDKTNLPPCRYVLPDAPLTVGDEAYGWYDSKTKSRADMVKSRDYLFELMERFSVEGEKTGHTRPIILIGFSQGGVMSLEAGLNYKGKVEAIVSMSGYLPYPSKTLAHPLAPFNTPILIEHGIEDDVVSEDWIQETVEAVKRSGYKPIFKEFPMGHQVTKDSWAAVSQFLKIVSERPFGAD